MNTQKCSPHLFICVNCYSKSAIQSTNQSAKLCQERDLSWRGFQTLNLFYISTKNSVLKPGKTETEGSNLPPSKNEFMEKRNVPKKFGENCTEERVLKD